jgi:hypothetical protein
MADMHAGLQSLDIAMQVQANIQNKAMDLQANVLQLIDSTVQPVEQQAVQAVRPSDGVRGQHVDVSA